MVKILCAAAVLAFALCGCSKKDDAAMERAKDSAAKAIDYSKDAASNVADAAKGAAQDTARSTKEGVSELKDALSTAGQRVREDTQKASNKAADKVEELHSAAAEKWTNFKIRVKRCHALSDTEKTQCMAEALHVYRTSHFNCETLPMPDKTQCFKYAEQWKSAVANPPKAAVTQTENPTMTAPTPGDPSASERNRDSTKQQQDAAGSLPESPKQN